MKTILSILQLFFICSLSYGQNFLNGSFENLTPTSCLYNIDNATFNSIISDVKGIGDMETLDIFNDVDCPNLGLAYDGHYCTSLENTSDSTTSTAISLKLGTALQLGNVYTISFFDRGLTTGGAGPIEIGISQNDSTFGSLIFTSPLVNVTWTQRLFNFTAPITGQYITARYKHSSIYNGLFLDNFSDGTSLGIVEQSVFKNLFNVFPNPTIGKFSIETKSRDTQMLTLTDMNGHCVLNNSFIEKTEIDGANLANGVYTLTVINSLGVFTEKLTIVK